MRGGVEPIPGYKYTVGLAYVAIPSDISRADYIKDCYLNSQLSIRCEDGAFYNRAPVSPEVLDFLTFPTDPKLNGTPVIYVTEEQYSQPVVVARLQMREELGDGKENQFKFRRKLGDQLVEINGSASDGTLNLIVDSAGQPGSINVHIFNQAQDCELNVDVAGDVNVTASGAIAQNAQDTITQTVTDAESGDATVIEQTPTEHKVTTQKWTFNEGSDPLGLGNEIRQLFSDLIDQVASITVVTAIGLQPIVNKAQVLKLKEQLDGVLSKVAFIDK